MTRSFWAIWIATLFISCTKDGKLQEENARLHETNSKLTREIESLNKKLDEALFGPSRLLTEARTAFSTNDVAVSKAKLSTLLKTHPLSPEAIEATTLLQNVNAALEKKARDAETEQRRMTDERQKKQEAALKGIKKTFDKVENVSWYKDAQTPVLGTLFYVYIGKSDDQTWLRMVAQYEGDDWIFAEKLIFLVDGNRSERPNLDFNRSNSSGTVWERADMMPSPQDVTLLRQIVRSKEAIIRFSGRDGHKDKILSQKEKDRIVRVFDAYEALGGKF